MDGDPARFLPKGAGKAMMTRWRGVLWGTVTAVWILLPFLVLGIWSFSRRWFFPDLLPREWGLRAWGYLFETAGPQVWGATLQSLVIATLTALISLAAGVPAGRALGLYRFRAKNMVSIFLMLPVVVPPLCVAMGLHLWFIRLRLAETLAGVVLVHLTVSLPYAVFVMWGVFANYDPAFEEQARSLGATPVQVLTRVMIPMTRSGILVAGLFAFLLSWSQYLGTLIIGGGAMVTLPILLFSLMGSGDRPVAAAVSLLFVLPACGVLLLSARHLGARQVRSVR